jgi:hypothetical protein
MRPEELCGQLAEPDRLRVFAAVVLGATTVDDVAERTGLPSRDVLAALRRLERSGLVTADSGGLVARAELFKEAMIGYQRERPPAEPLDDDPDRDAVLRTFITDGRITALPAVWSKRRILLEHIVAAFEPGVRYPEREVDAVLRAWHDDHAALRRYLVDEQLMARADGIYWRIWGRVF